MPTGLVALLDDIAGITKLAAASLDDVAAATGKAGSKAIGVVVDDAAVTPRYMVGFEPKRELPMIWKIALGSFRNKLVFILPAALALSAFAPWLLTPLLMIGGTYLCFEGAEKILEAVGGGHAEEEVDVPTDAKALEDQKVSGAIRTDFILSAEIMAIALAEVAGGSILSQAVALAIVAIAITVGVYGAAGLIVKLDDIGLALAERRSPAVQAIGRGMVKAMPIIMAVLSVVGIAAMIWVGGQILWHGLETLGVEGPAHVIHAAAEGAAGALPGMHGLVSWVVTALCSAIVGLVVGGIIAAIVHAVKQRRAHP